jgi:hypothetical protein
MLLSEACEFGVIRFKLLSKVIGGFQLLEQLLLRGRSASRVDVFF